MCPQPLTVTCVCLPHSALWKVPPSAAAVFTVYSLYLFLLVDTQEMVPIGISVAVDVARVESCVCVCVPPNATTASRLQLWDSEQFWPWFELAWWYSMPFIPVQ